MKQSLENRKVKLLCITGFPPLPTMGGAMAFYRHFVERKDFEIKVITSCDPFPSDTVSYQPVLFRPSRLTRRLFRTRLLPWLYGLHSLTAFGRIPSAVWRAAKEFKPDAVFTIAGNWDYSALVAERVARRLNVPLVASFNDWFNFGWFPAHPAFHQAIERRFRRFYKEADLALCTCEGMRESLGSHSNAHVLYPIGSPSIETIESFKPYRQEARPFVVGFAGNLGEWYGPMIERLVQAAHGQKLPVEFRIYGKLPPTNHDSGVRPNGAYKGHLPFDKLKSAMGETDALILPMGFEERASLIERTSFKTKFLDYLSYQKPILVWGPEYCSAVRVAREFDSAEICTQPDAAAILEKILTLSNAPERQSALVRNAGKMYADRFHPDKIHAAFVGKIRQLVES